MIEPWLAMDRLCCGNVPIEDSYLETMRLDSQHEKAITRPLPHEELVQLCCTTAQVRIFADRDELAREIFCVADDAQGIDRHCDTVQSDPEKSSHVDDRRGHGVSGQHQIAHGADGCTGEVMPRKPPMSGSTPRTLPS